jgi:SAM-dependent methyltransferase
MGAAAMVLTAQALAETKRAFDNVAPTYGAANDANQVIRIMRARAIKALRRHVRPGARLLDLGCGPGPDVLRLASEGFDVTAVDASPAMVARAADAIRISGLGHLARVHLMAIQEIDRLPQGAWDAAYSNLGPLNCVPDLADAARAIRSRLKPGGVLVASVIGRTCPWEWLIHGVKRDWGRVRLRYSRGFVPVPLEGATVWMQYVSPSELAQVCAAAGFQLIGLRALGLVVPPPYLEGFCRRNPGLLRKLTAAEDLIGGWPVLRHWGDHFLMELKRS